MKILAVDDNPTNLEIIKLLLRPTGCRVLEATSGASAVETARTEQPALVFMDLAMPGEWDGLEATRRIKADPATSHIVVVAVTAMVASGDQAQALAAGCTDFVRKPYTRKDLFTLVARHFPQLQLNAVAPRLSPSAPVFQPSS